MGVAVGVYNRHLKRYDRELYAKRDMDGIVSVYRRNKRFVAYDLDGNDFQFLIDSPEFVVALTDNWTKTGHPVPWGPDLVLNRLGEIDSWAKKDLIEELDKQNEQVEKSRARGFRNEAEAFWSDNRKAFAKATDDILTHSLDKSDKKRRIRDGNRERKQG
jgi:hypothetical protein